MFSNKLDFKQEFERRLSEKYGRSVPDSHITERYDILGEMIRDFAGYEWRTCRECLLKGDQKQVIYFSMEFLIGRLMLNNMQNLGIYQIAKEGLAEMGIDINEIEDHEPDAGLGNGGLGRLAACFLDSAASLGLPVHGNTIRYDYGFFRQKFVDGKQVELPDQWMSDGFVFEVRKPKHAVEVGFYGHAETYPKNDGTYGMRTVNSVKVRAVPYDVSIVGYRNGVANSLRLWSAEPSAENLPTDVSFDEYLQTLKELCFGLYPDDSTEHGRKLRLRQQYFLVSAGLQSCMRAHMRKFGTLDNFADYYCFQLNDTHPILAIPEMMRLMMDEYNYGWDKAWETVRKTVAYTNHTVMPEALEKWPLSYIREVVPRIAMIIEEIDRRFNIEMAEKNVIDSERYQMRIIKDGQVHMSNLAIFACFSVNGVAKLHTEILEKETFRAFYNLYPEKFSDKTNGVTHRRWLLNSNRDLSKLINHRIGHIWFREPEKLSLLRPFATDPATQEEFLQVKHDAKVRFASFVKDEYSIEINPDSIYDVQIKRLHAYKRQLLNVFRIIHEYECLLKDPNYDYYPHTYIFGAKAAPSYVFAKRVIELILAVADKINNDPRIGGKIKIVFVENYGVTLAERIIPAADISEQISTAGKEASGTSNMKLMMNGAISLGTRDGANVEIAERAGEENEVMFGLTADEVAYHNDRGDYDPWALYREDGDIRSILDSLLNGSWAKDDRFRLIFDEIMNGHDQFYILADFRAYLEASKKIDALYQDRARWAEMALCNIAMSGIFSSDRTIAEYNRDIWHLTPYEVAAND